MAAACVWVRVYVTWIPFRDEYHPFKHLKEAWLRACMHAFLLDCMHAAARVKSRS